MRVVAEIPNSQFKITVFCWNQKYLLKIEQGLLEQTYKINEADVKNDAEIRRIVLDGEFMHEVSLRFDEMGGSVFRALDRL